MSGLSCLHCGATTSNGLALCELCQRFAAEIVQHLPIYFRNLARWRPGRAGSRPVPGSRALYDGPVRTDGTGDRISDRLDEAATALITWARKLTEDRSGFPRPLRFSDAVLTQDLPDEVAEALVDDNPRVVAALCDAFDRHLTTVATLEWAGEFVRDLAEHEARLRVFTETLVPGWYAGECRRRISMEATCGTKTYVVPGLTWVTCGGCGTTTYAHDHLDAIIDEARDWTARPKEVAGALVAMLDGEQSVERLYDRIRKWESFGWITSVRKLDRDGDPVGPKRYRLGDVLDLATGKADAPTRPMRMTSA